jgi:hypothetical protein
VIKQSRFNIELCTDAVVTVLAFDSPHQTANRFAERGKETETIRGGTPTTVNSEMDVFVRNAIDGWRPSVADVIAAVTVACEHDLDTANQCRIPFLSTKDSLSTDYPHYFI